MSVTVNRCSCSSEWLFFSELDAANEQIDHHGSNFSELQQRVDDIETKQGKQLVCFKHISFASSFSGQCHNSFI